MQTVPVPVPVSPAPPPVPRAASAPGPYLVNPETYRRSAFLGSSDIPAVLGVSPYRSALDCWLDKTQGREDDDNPAKRRGRRMEPVILQWASEDYGVEFLHRNRRFAHPVHAFMAAEIDAESKEGGEWVNNEVKSVHPFMAREWGDENSDALPLHYLCQAMWGLHVTGRGLCRVYAGIGDELRVYIVERDEALIAEMSRQGAAFWKTYVQGGLRPDIEPAHPRVFDTLKRLFPGTNGETLTATPAQEHWYAVMQDAAARVQEYKAVADGARAHLLHEMGEAAQLAFADGQALKRALRKRKGYTVEPGEYWESRIAKLAVDRKTTSED